MLALRVRIGAGNWTERLSTPKLTRLTCHYYRMSQAVDNPRSTLHRYYYQCANECERRGINLTQLLEKE